MKSPRSVYLSAGGYEVHVTEWGNEANPLLVMWHGLARTGRDFDEAAEALSDRYLVVCPDTIGRGLSQWSRNGNADYNFAIYSAMARDLVDHYEADTLRWIGTSMGGLIGMTVAASVLKDRVTHLVMNDVGPELPAAALDRIATYVGNPPVFDTVAELEAFYRKAYVPFGDNSDVFWRRMADTGARRTDAGKVTVHYDPAIVSLVTTDRQSLDAWPVYDAVSARTLVLRGAQSDLLLPEVAAAMQTRGPKAEMVELKGFGHAPTLASELELAILREFLAK